MEHPPAALTIYVTWNGVEQVDLLARTNQEELASLALYACIRPALDDLKDQIIKSGVERPPEAHGGRR